MNLMHSCTCTIIEIVHSPDLIPDVHILLGKVVGCFLRHAGITMLAAVLHIPRQEGVFLHQSAVCIRQQHCFNVHIVNSHICSLRGIHRTLCKYCTEQCSCRYPVRIRDVMDMSVGKTVCPQYPEMATLLAGLTYITQAGTQQPHSSECGTCV